MTSSETKLQAHPVAAVKKDHQITIRIRTRRGPIRSPSHPPGTSKSAYATPKIQNAQLISIFVSPRSRWIAGAACEMQTRSIYVMIASAMQNRTAT